MRSDLHALYPKIYSGVLETDILADIEDVQFDKWFEDMDDARRNQFILSADIRGIEAFEVLYEIKADPSTEDAEFRRRRVLSKMLMRIPFTWRFLLQYLKQIDAEYKARLYNNKYLVMIESAGFTKTQINMLYNALRQIIPANMLLGFKSIVEGLTATVPVSIAAPMTVTRVELPWLEEKLVAEVVPAAGLMTVERATLPVYYPPEADPDDTDAAYFIGPGGEVTAAYITTANGPERVYISTTYAPPKPPAGLRPAIFIDPATGTAAGEAYITTTNGPERAYINRSW